MAIKKPTANAYQQLKGDIDGGKLRSLYVLYGEESYLREQAVELLKSALVPPGMEPFCFRLLQGGSLEPTELEDAVSFPPMGGDRLLVLVYDWDMFRSESRRTAMTALLRDLPDYLCLALVYDTVAYKPDNRTALGKLIKERAAVLEFVPQPEDKLVNWLIRRFLALGKTISRQDASYLSYLCGGLMTGLASETEKIAAYAGGDTITRQDIDAVAEPVLDARVFRMTDAIAEGSFDRAVAALGELYQAGEHPIMILSVLGKQLRQLWSARLALETGRGQADVARLWGMRNSWQTERIMQAARRYDLPWCRRAVRLAARADLEMKSAARDAEGILTDLLLTLAVGVGEQVC